MTADRTFIPLGELLGRTVVLLPSLAEAKRRENARDIAAGVESTGDTTTLEDLGVLAQLRQKDDEE